MYLYRFQYGILYGLKPTYDGQEFLHRVSALLGDHFLGRRGSYNFRGHD